MKGLSVYYKCLSSGVAKWNFSSGSLPSNIVVDRQNLFINGVSDINVGMYECEGTMAGPLLRTGHPVLFYSRFKLQN